MEAFLFRVCESIGNSKKRIYKR